MPFRGFGCLVMKWEFVGVHALKMKVVWQDCLRIYTTFVLDLITQKYDAQSR